MIEINVFNLFSLGGIHFHWSRKPRDPRVIDRRSRLERATGSVEFWENSPQRMMVCVQREGLSEEALERLYDFADSVNAEFVLQRESIIIRYREDWPKSKETLTSRQFFDLADRERKQIENKASETS